MLRFLLLLTAMLVALFSFSQVRDTVRIPEVLVTSTVKYMVGAKKQTMDEHVVERLGHQSLGKAISRYTPIYIRQDAGGLSTIYFRGTSPDHTAIMFDGINLNSLTLGHSNMSDIPMFLFDEVDLQYGGSSSLFGTGAIGGTIQLRTDPKFDKKTKIVVQQDIASFGTYFSGLKLTSGTERFENSLRMLNFQSENDFPFQGDRDIVTGRYSREKQRNASLHNWAILNQSHLRLSEGETVGLKVWYGHNWHEIQPNITSNSSESEFEDLENQNLRAILSYNKKLDDKTWKASINYVHDYQVHDGSENQSIGTDRIGLLLEHETKKIFGGDLKIGGQYRHIIPTVYAYEDNLTEQQVEIYLFYQRQFFNRLMTSINLREVWVSEYSTHFSPTLNANLLIARTGNSFIKLKASASESYRIPDFNERFWGDLGNPDLFVESGYNLELGAILQGKSEGKEYNFQITAYYSMIDNWIQWNNISGWRPQNFKKVQNKGIELSANMKLDLAPGKLEIGGNYSFNSTVEKESHNPNSEKIGRQLMYVPVHTSNLFVEYKRQSFFTSIDANLTGWRYNEADKILDGYFLTNTEAGYELAYIDLSFLLSCSVNNIFDVNYQNRENFAMPGRNYRLSLKVKLN